MQIEVNSVGLPFIVFVKCSLRFNADSVFWVDGKFTLNL